MSVFGDNLLSVIFSHCSFRSLLRCRGVCTQWKKLIDDNKKLFNVLPSISWKFKDECGDYYDDYPLQSIEGDNLDGEWVVNEVINKTYDPKVLKILNRRIRIPITYDANDSYSFEEDVDCLIFFRNGINDALSWLMIGKIDGYYFYMDAYCDYTGFECQGSIIFTLARDLYSLIEYAMGTEERKAFGKFIAKNYE